MSIKGDKTFEEIVERLVALFRPQTEDAVDVAGTQASTSDSAQHGPSRAILTSTDEDAPTG
jgi:hypothetical protein